MNKMLLAAVFAIAGIQAQAQNAEALWNIRFYTIDSFEVNMEHYRNKPLALFTINASAPDMQQVLAIDSLNRKYNGAVNFIGVLLNDAAKTPGRGQVLNRFRSGTGISFPVTGFSKSKKTKNADERHPLLYWLEEQSGNRHFVLNTSVPGQLFLVNEHGLLYGVLSPGATISEKQAEQWFTKSPGGE